MAELLYRLGKASAKRAWIVIVAWLAVLGLAGGAFAVGFGALATSFDVPGTASGEVIDELAEELPDYAGASGQVVFHSEDGEALTAEQQSEIAQVAEGIADLPDVAQVVDPFQTEQERADREQEIADGRTEIEDGQAQLDAGQAQLDAAVADLDAGQEQLGAGQEQLDAARQQAEAAGAPAAQIAALDAQQAELDAQQAQIDAGREEIAAQQADLDDGRADLAEAAEQLELGAELLALSDGIRVVSEDGATALVNVSFDVPLLELDATSKDAVISYVEANPIDGVEYAFSSTLAQSVPNLVGIGEIVGLAIAAIVLLVMLGTAVAAALPIATALVGVGIAVLAALSLSGVLDMSSVTPVLGIMLGLAVGIDYSLFIINRHRTQLLEGAEMRESIGLANGTAGNAVTFAGSTVIIALLALNITGIPFLGLMGTVGAFAVLIAVLIAVTLTPALLGLIGPRVLNRRARAKIGTVHHEDIGAKPMGTWRAVLTAAGAIIALLVIAIPALSMRVGLPDGSSEPEESYAYQAYSLTEEAFGAGANGTLLISATLPGDLDETSQLQAQLDIATALSDLDGVVAVAPIAVSDSGTLAAFQVVPEDGPSSVSTEELVRDLRALPPVDGQYELGVAGQAAINIDISENLADVLPLYIAVVVGLSLVIMIVVFRSLLVPIIATGGFILSLFATYGATVAVFQWGWGAEIIGLHATGPILSFLPVLLVGILFGLAMDYQLFLSSGMREAFVHGAPARLAVMRGLRAGRAVVTAAGLIMVSVFGGFIFAESTMIRSIGFGLAFGVLLDAFVVRMLLMPALMHLLGRSAWWLPRWLDRIVPNVDVEGAQLERAHHAPWADPAEAPDETTAGTPGGNAKPLTRREARARGDL
ncbi:MMPL family transporter [Microbacterium aquimaris]|uniref:MMPL family transporter n=1 Tax=Microbacterium aquimaris TaxID=459816 RepID=A0ABU5N4G4_9MICO|nr:MMPL family transporter [Microbacterium aquimaris]MDZ8160961.1 MMPL family transporter [Microbacterium aquimaris]